MILKKSIIQSHWVNKLRQMDKLKGLMKLDSLRQYHHLTNRSS